MDATSITFEIPGDPIPQPRARFANGRTYTPDRNGIRTYKDAIGLMAEAKARRAGWARSDAAHAVELELVFARPQSHRTKSGELRAGAPEFPGHRSGDLDNLEKGVWDAITDCAAVWDDDAQIVRSSAWKRYAGPGEAARLVVTIRRLA